MQTTKPRLTSAQRRARRYGTKRYAAHILYEALREYAKALRAAKLSPESWGRQMDRSEAHGKFLGAWSALSAIGALSHERGAHFMRLHDRLLKAKVARRPRPFELRRAA